MLSRARVAEKPSEPGATLPRRRNPAWRWVVRTLAALVIGVIVLDLGLFLEGLFARSLALGAGFSLLIGAAAVALFSWIGMELRQIHKLAAVEAIRLHAAEVMARDGHGNAMGFIAEARRALANRPAVARRFDRLEDMVLETMSDRDALELFRREILLPLDAEAYAAVRRAAQWTAIGVSASPIAGLNFTAAYAYNDAEVTKDNPDADGVSREGNRPILAPENLASAWTDDTFQSGALKGLLGGLLALGLCYAGYLLFRDSTGGPFTGLLFFRPRHMVVILVFGVLLGLAGSLVSVGRHLRNV